MCAHAWRHFARSRCLGASAASRAWLAVALLFFTSHAARAEPPSAPKEAAPRATEDAASHVVAGDRARVAGRFADAEASYRKAIAIAADDATSLRLALCLAAEGKLLDAAALLEPLATTTSALGETDRARAAEALADARRGLATIELRVEDGADVELDGARLGVTPLRRTIYVEPGPHAIRATRTDRGGSQANVDARGGHGYVVDLPLPRPTLAPKDTEATPVVPSPAEAFSGSAGQLRAAGLGLGATLLAGGAIAFGVARENDDLVSAYKRITQARGVPSCFDAHPKEDRDCRRLAQSVNASSLATTAATVLFVGAGAVAAASAVTWLMLPLRSSPTTAGTRVSLTAAVAPSGGGLSLEASW